jgi:hypothetical protein
VRIIKARSTRRRWSARDLKNFPPRHRSGCSTPTGCAASRLWVNAQSDRRLRDPCVSEKKGWWDGAVSWVEAGVFAVCFPFPSLVFHPGLVRAIRDQARCVEVLGPTCHRDGGSSFIVAFCSGSIVILKDSTYA